MISNFEDLAASERQQLINSTVEQFSHDSVNWPNVALALADQLLDARGAALMAVHWLNQQAPGRAREELLRVLGVK